MTAPTQLRSSRAAKGLGLRRLVVGTDFSPDGNRAVRRAASLPFTPGASLLLVHVIPAGIAPAVASLATGAAEIRLEALAARLRDAFEGRRRADVSVHARVVRGSPPDVLDRLGRAFRAEVIVVGRRGQSRIRELVLGSTARRLLRGGRLPVLVVGHPPSDLYRRAVVGFDFTPEALRAARMTRQVVPHSATLFAVHTFENPYRGLPTGLIPDRTIRIEEVLRERARLVRKAMDTVGRGARPWEVLVREGDPRRVLLELVRSRRADLVAVGSAGKSRVARTFLGSVAEAVLEAAPSDVLLVRRRPLR